MNIETHYLNNKVFNQFLPPLGLSIFVVVSMVFTGFPKLVLKNIGAWNLHMHIIKSI